MAPRLEMIGESLRVPNSCSIPIAPESNPCPPVFPRLLQNLERFRTPYLPAFISEQGNDGRLRGTET